jgi:hypothetical protein
MPTNADDLNELINGLLDGVLSDEEQKTLELALKADPSLETRLSEMQALRRSLLRGRSVGRLGPDFSKQIVSAARKRAESLGEDAPEWLRGADGPNEDRVAKPAIEPRVAVSLESEPIRPASSMVQRAWQVWIPMLAVATAASLILYFAGPMSSPSGVQTLVGDRTPPTMSGDEPDRSRSIPKAEEVNELAAELLARGSGASENLDSNLSRVDAPSVAMDSNRTVDGTEPTETGSDFNRARERAMASAEDSSDKPSDRVQSVLNATGVTNPVYTLVADIAMDAAAEQNDILRSLLDEHELVYADDLNISSDQLDALIESRMVGEMSLSDEAKQAGDVQVWFVRSKGKRIMSFLRDIESQYKDFPQYRLDMTIDPSVIQLMNQLSSINNDSEGVRRLTYRGKDELGLVSAFPAGVREGEYLDIEKRRQLRSQPKAPKFQAADEASYMILLVRRMPSTGNSP